MSDLAKKLEEKLEESRKNVEESGTKILTLDIERMKGKANIEFWDLGDYKNRRIHPDDVEEWPRTICVASNWYGERRIQFDSEWHDGREGFLENVWNKVNESDIVVGHNVAGFDMKKLNSEWRDLGFSPPSSYKMVDTLREARRQFGDESRTLDALCKRMGLESKTDRYDVEVARAALLGDREAQIKIQAYNEGDIVATLDLYDHLRGWMPNHPHLGDLLGEELRCNQCHSDDLERNGTYLAVRIRYIEYRCKSCGGNVRGSEHAGAARTHGVR